MMKNTSYNCKDEQIYHTELHDFFTAYFSTQHFLSYKFFKQFDTKLSNKHFIIEFQYLQPYNFLGSSTAIVKPHVRAWLLVSYEKEILGTPNSLLAETLVWCISMQML